MRNRNYQEDFNQNRSQRRKKTTGVIALGLAGVLVLGSLFAYFSDMLEGTGKVNAGTLDLRPGTALQNAEGVPITGESGYAIMRLKNGSVDVGDTIEEGDLIPYNNHDGTSGEDVLNPGDCLVVVGDVENVGSKSAWLQSAVTLTIRPYTEEIKVGEENARVPQITDVMKFLKFYTEEGGVLVELDDEQIVMDTDLATVAMKKSDMIVNGTVETETEIGVNSTEYKGNMLVIKFLTAAEIEGTSINYAQGHTIDMNATWKAIQYRNNPTPEDQWSQVDEMLTISGLMP